MSRPAHRRLSTPGRYSAATAPRTEEGNSAARIAGQRARLVAAGRSSDRVLGLSPDSHIDGLKEYLHAATLTKSPTEKLDLVILEDYDHFAELLAQEGVPLAREMTPTHAARDRLGP
jgi:hypothetical protein